MTDTAISVENLSKRYVIGLEAQKGDGLRHTIEDAIRAPLSWMRSRCSRNGNAQEEFWALRDVDFAVEKGETLGLVGPNGCGKSTLLQIVSGILQPTTGRVVATLIRERSRIPSSNNSSKASRSTSMSPR